MRAQGYALVLAIAVGAGCVGEAPEGSSDTGAVDTGRVDTHDDTRNDTHDDTRNDTHDDTRNDTHDDTRDDTRSPDTADALTGDTSEADTQAVDTVSGDTGDSADQEASDLDPCATTPCDDQDPCNGVETCAGGQCLPGDAPLPDGEPCDDGRRCYGGVCLPPFCGDGFRDADEVCDDGNRVAADGCELNCSHTCEADEACADGQPCNGDEGCSFELGCVPGTPLVDGTSCGELLECQGAVCLSAGCGDGVQNVSLGEQCDDGNGIDGDGCDGDCRYSCALASDCDNLDACDGVESCNTVAHVCVPGEPLPCRDGNDCTEDLCEPRAGCEFLLIDGDGDGQSPEALGACGLDCDDGNAAIFAGAEELCDTVDNDCDGAIDEVAPTWYVDCDGDGFAASTAGSLPSCEPPTTRPSSCYATVSGWVSLRPGSLASTDCDDANPRVMPAQLGWFTAAIGGTSSYDYDCDGVEEKQYPSPAGPCTTVTLKCGTASGWTVPKVPGCGQTGLSSGSSETNFQVCSQLLAGCQGTLEQRRQGCH